MPGWGVELSGIASALYIFFFFFFSSSIFPFCLCTSASTFPLTRSTQPSLGPITPVQSLCLSLPVCFELGSWSWGSHYIPWLEENKLINFTSAVILSVLPAGREVFFRYCLLRALGHCSKALTANLCAPAARASGRRCALCSVSVRGDAGPGAAPWMRSRAQRLPCCCGIGWAAGLVGVFAWNSSW